MMSSRQGVALAVGILMALSCGQLYAFGGYEKDLKARMEMGQSEVQLMGMVLDGGVTVTQPFAGWIYDRFGSCISASGASALAAAGYFSVYVAVKNKANAPMMAFGFFLVGFASALAYICALSTNCKNFSDRHRGVIVGVLASGFGLSAFLMSLSYLVIFNGAEHISEFFLFWAIALASIFALGACCVRPVKAKEDEGRGYDRVGTHADAANPGPGAKGNAQASGVLENVIFMVQQAVFWYLFLPFLAGTGGGLFLVNNMGTMVEAANLSPDMPLTQRLIMLYSVCNFSGRLSVGFLSDRTCLRRGHLVTKCLLLLSVTHFWAAFIHSETGSHELSGRAFYPIVMGVGFGYGGLWCLVPTIVSEQFGMQNFGKNFGLYCLAPLVAGLSFNSLASFVYEANISDGNSSIGDSGAIGDRATTCFGGRCYFASFLFSSCIALIGALLSVFLIPYTNRGSCGGPPSGSAVEDEATFHQINAALAEEFSSKSSSQRNNAGSGSSSEELPKSSGFWEEEWESNGNSNSQSGLGQPDGDDDDDYELELAEIHSADSTD